MFNIRTKPPKGSPTNSLSRRAPDIIRDALIRAMRKAKELSTTRYIRRGGGAPVPGKLTYRGGRLVGSITHRVWKHGNVWRAKLGSDVKYARIHEKGGVIRPARGEYLTFYIPHADRWVRTKEVKMPKRPYLTPSMKAVVPLLIKDLGNRYAIKLKTFV
jgi:phage gpG-like protein